MSSSKQFRSYGKVHQKSMRKMAKEYKGQLSRNDIHAFKSKHPEHFQKLLAMQNSIRAEGKRIEGRLKGLHLFDFLYPEHDNTCKGCGEETVWADDKGYYREFCSQTCVNSSSEVVARRKATSLERFGVEDANKCAKIKKKKRKIFMEKYGVDNPSKVDSVKAKKSATMLKHYGKNHWTQNEEHFHKVGLPFNEETLAKAKATCVKRFGFDNPFKVSAIQEQIKIHTKEKYGCNPGAIPNGFKAKAVTDRFGKTHIVQGYEPFAIEFFNQIKTVVRIVTGAKKLPRYRYADGSGKNRNYHPDIMVHTTNTTHIVEVKSDWTLQLNLDINIRKFKVASANCIRKGFTFWVMVFDSKGKCVKVKNPKTLADLVKAGLPVSRQPK